MAADADIQVKVQGISLPFDAASSSCSDRTPAAFRWTTEDAQIKVCLDNAIVSHARYGGAEKYGWICESRAIVSQLVAFLRRNLHAVLPFYRKIFTCERELLTLHEKFAFCFAGSNAPWIPLREQGLYAKSRLCSMIASPKQMCRGHLLRHHWAAMLRGKVDLFGGAAGSVRIGSDFRQPWLSKLPGLRDYMFSVVMENDSYPTYFTEKITDCFATGTIPVYWGAPDIVEHFNPQGIIRLEPGVIEKLTPDLYYSRLDAVHDNYERVQRLKPADDYLYEQIASLG